MILCCPDFDAFIGVLNLTNKRHSADNIQKIGLSFRIAIAIVTESPKCMIRFINDLVTKDSLKWLLPFPCCLHVLSNLIKDICKSQEAHEVVRCNSKLTTFFTSSHFWLEKSRAWMVKNNVTRGLVTLCKIRWYSIAKVCMAVRDFQAFFFSSLIKCKDANYDSPLINKDVQHMITAKHFDENSHLVDVVKPISDIIGRLEQPKSNISDVLLEMFRISKLFKSLPADNKYKNSALVAVSKRIKSFDDVTYFVGLYMSPNYRKLATSTKYPFATIARRIFEIALQWEWRKTDVKLLKADLIKYEEYQEPFSTEFNPSLNDLLAFWNGVSHLGIGSSGLPAAPMLARFAIKILSIKPHAARIEALLPSLSLSKNDRQNRLGVNTLVDMGRIKIDLQRQVNDLKDDYKNSAIGKERLKNPAKIRKTDHTGKSGEKAVDKDSPSKKSNDNENKSNEFLHGTDENIAENIEDALEELAHHETLEGDEKEALLFLDSLFNFDLFDENGIHYKYVESKANSKEEEPESTEENEPWNVEEIMEEI